MYGMNDSSYLWAHTHTHTERERSGTLRGDMCINPQTIWLSLIGEIKAMLIADKDPL